MGYCAGTENDFKKRYKGNSVGEKITAFLTNDAGTIGYPHAKRLSQTLNSHHIQMAMNEPQLDPKLGQKGGGALVAQWQNSCLPKLGQKGQKYFQENQRIFV